MKHTEKVAQTIEEMGQKFCDWKACHIKVRGTGAPEAVLPNGYTTAPSRFQNTQGSSGHCEVCYHSIKNFYAIQNDTTHQIMFVGSECVKLFGGVSGEQMEIDASVEKYTEIISALRHRLQVAQFEYSRNPTNIGIGEEAGNIKRLLKKDGELSVATQKVAFVKSFYKNLPYSNIHV